MDIFIGNLPDNMSVHDLRQLIHEDSVTNAHFRVVHKTSVNGGNYSYGRIRLQQSDLASRMIREHQGLSLEGKSVEVREYFHRNGDHDRRSRFWQGSPWTGMERRTSERRRRH